MYTYMHVIQFVNKMDHVSIMLQDISNNTSSNILIIVLILQEVNTNVRVEYFNLLTVTLYNYLWELLPDDFGREIIGQNAQLSLDFEILNQINNLYTDYLFQSAYNEQSNDLYFFVQELAKHIDDYTATYEPDDQLEWSLVLGEIRAFIEVSKYTVLLIKS